MKDLIEKFLLFFFRYPAYTFILGLLILSFGVFLGLYDHHHEDSSFWISFSYVLIKEFGFAVIISVAISLGVERISKEKHEETIKGDLELIKKSVFKAVYGEKINTRFFEKFDEIVLKNNFVRSVIKVNITFIADPPVHEGSKIQLRIDTRFTVTNTGDGPASYDVPISVEKPLSGQEQNGTHIIGYEINGHPLSVEQLAAADTAGPDTANFKIFNHPIGFFAGEEKTIYSIATVHKFGRDHFIWQTLLPSDGLEVNVIYPDVIEVEFDALYAGETVNESPTNLPGQIKRKIMTPLLPANGFSIWWSPKLPGS